ncbi:hypothetical protein [Agitococcus lubricus]|uniref:Uncharacterized protein n=1 Tax=Agitococcus lubricus TaxID=1077255 RepID=A0A2T5IZF9_9GAMM|nr:hypothetical protein [Agitococcus lubricus]PTQ89336.1 hypothetical protein C8N29_10769 [Agitococcus lubricus]
MRAANYGWCLLLISPLNYAAESLSPEFVEYLVQFADNKELFDANDYALIQQQTNPKPETHPTKTVQQTIRSTNTQELKP